MAWMDFFTLTRKFDTTFCDDLDLVHTFLDILTCPARGYISCSDSLGFGPSHNSIRVRAGLVIIEGATRENQICFDCVYFPFLLFKRKYHFRKIMAAYWPFVLGEDGQFVNESSISQIIRQIKREETLPKSAAKCR
jgi:hypothetical protein